MTKARTPRRRWYVVRTNIKCEDKAARSLRAAGYRAYVPKMRKTIIHHRTKAQIDRHFHLFNRYIFMAVIEGASVSKSARECDGVEEVLRVQHNGELAWGEVSREQIAMVMRAQRRGEFNDISPKSKKAASIKRFAMGSSIKVREGHALSGFYGTVKGIKGRGVIKAMLQIFGGAVPVELGPEWVEPVERAA